MNPDPTDLNRQIDLLVDDALDAPARRALFLRIDADPGGWRRCALAFLEAQAWRADLQSAFEARPAPHQPRARVPFAITGIAAGFLLAFALGWSARGGATQATVATSPAANGPNSAESVQAGPQHDAADEAAALTEATSILTPPALESVEQPDEPVRWREAARQLQQHGYEVEPPQRRVIAVELRDGRRVTLPVEEMRAQYVGHQTF